MEDIEEVPPNSVVVFSAHGVSPEVRKAAECRNLLTIDATCPLVQKVHVYVQQKAKEGFQIVIIGHKNHGKLLPVCIAREQRRCIWMYTSSRRVTEGTHTSPHTQSQTDTHQGSRTST